ncbi:hypothetical protein [Sulfitobacter donghicola]|uniref:Pilus assembly protein PilZ n=1 Tax=Sulfitobacter donghicola DSW-25 = KCTC 12864 = JCM 14565 TaxID=1300350 RepID=A0A073IIR4_9RHOB|nr:hypothetical protein [Sulfitobacter donghicola]KEJ89460.1 pilus assembly protein PilZ [Sulfitobacter donghicola DSW-25 = KCTC 12864 = JCM 14565]KIN69280.1 Pilus assembly domain protein [Sulfitobacter donghicola DSW-25 = KCTC 12864 = JCM 14565]
MSTQTNGTPTPPKVKELATQAAKLPKTALLGVFGNTNAPKALILLPQGETKTVQVGDSIGADTVLAIGKDQLVLARGASQRILHLPRG